MSDWVWVDYQIIELGDTFYHAGVKWIKTELGGRSDEKEKPFKSETKVLTNNPKYEFQVPKVPLLVPKNYSKRNKNLVV